MRKLKFAGVALATLFLCHGAALARVPSRSKSTRASTRPENSNSAGASAADSPVLQRRDSRYRLYPSDQIAIAFPLTPEFNQTVTIEPDGYASLAGAGDVRLAGLTTQQSAASIKTAYAKILHDPIITVELKNFEKPFFVVNGQVNHPGKYDLRGPTSAESMATVTRSPESTSSASSTGASTRIRNCVPATCCTFRRA
jgi:protein involved in polysaccharide export with SLBB domain